MELNSIFFIDHALAFHFTLATAAVVCSYSLIKFFKLTSALGRHAMDAAAVKEPAPQGVFLLRRHRLDARLPGTAV